MRPALDDKVTSMDASPGNCVNSAAWMAARSTEPLPIWMSKDTTREKDAPGVPGGGAGGMEGGQGGGAGGGIGGDVGGGEGGGPGGGGAGGGGGGAGGWTGRKYRWHMTSSGGGGDGLGGEGSGGGGKGGGFVGGGGCGGAGGGAGGSGGVAMVTIAAHMLPRSGQYGLTSLHVSSSEVEM